MIFFKIVTLIFHFILQYMLKVNDSQFGSFWKECMKMYWSKRDIFDLEDWTFRTTKFKLPGL